MEGTVKWFDHTKRFGFIKPNDDGQDVFVHQSGLAEETASRIKDGCRVEFDVTDGQKGPQASNVRVLDD